MIRNGRSVSQSFTEGDVAGDDFVGGLGGYISGSVYHCYSKASVTGGDRAGGLAGSSAAYMYCCYAISTVTCGQFGAGGLVGANGEEGEIRYCAAWGDVSGGIGVGGLAGYNSGFLSNCYSTFRVTCNKHVGGFVGLNSKQEIDDSGHILHCYAAGRVEGREYVGGLIGNNSPEHHVPGLITASFWDTERSGQVESDGGTGITTAEMKRMSTFGSAGWDFETPVWKIVEEKSTPYLWWESYAGGAGTADDPYLIATAEHMRHLGLSPHDWDGHFRLIDDIDLSSTALNSIGTSSVPFTGVFDGGGKTISGLYYKSSKTDPAGFFRIAAEGARIRGLLLIGPVIDARKSDAAGALAGVLDGRVMECGVEGGSVTGGGYAGGLVGICRGSTENSYAENKVYGSTASGGLIGNLLEGRIRRCYAAGQFAGVNTLGGVAGMNDHGYIRECYWNLQTSGVQRICALEDAGSGCDDGMGRTTEEMRRRGTFVDWDFEYIWKIKEGAGYPRLRMSK